MAEFIFSGRYSRLCIMIAFASLLIASTTEVHSQISFLKKVDEIGVTVGPGIVWFKDNGIYQGGQYFKRIQNFGLDIKWFTRNPRLKWDAKILLEQLGNQTSIFGYFYDSTFNIVTGNTIFIHDWKYLTMPVSLHYYFFERMRFYTSVGVFGGYFIKERLHIEDVFGGNKRTLTLYNFGSDIKSYNFGGTVGIGYQVIVKEIFSLSFELNGRFGFVDLSTDYFNKRNPVRTQAIAFTVLLSASVNRNKLN